MDDIVGLTEVSIEDDDEAEMSLVGSEHVAGPETSEMVELPLSFDIAIGCCCWTAEKLPSEAVVDFKCGKLKVDDALIKYSE